MGKEGRKVGFHTFGQQKPLIRQKELAGHPSRARSQHSSI